MYKIDVKDFGETIFDFLSKGSYGNFTSCIVEQSGKDTIEIRKVKDSDKDTGLLIIVEDYCVTIEIDAQGKFTAFPIRGKALEVFKGDYNIVLESFLVITSLYSF